MGNFAVLCKDDGCERRTKDKLILLEKRCKKHEADTTLMKKRVSKIVEWKKKIEEERKTLLEKCAEQNSTITEMKRIVHQKDDDLQEKMKISEIKSQKLKKMEREINILEIRIKEYREENMFQNEQIQELGIMEYRMASLESERDDVLAENETIDNEIEMLENENENLKSLLRKINIQQKQKKHNLKATIHAMPNSPSH